MRVFLSVTLTLVTFTFITRQSHIQANCQTLGQSFPLARRFPAPRQMLQQHGNYDDNEEEEDEDGDEEEDENILIFLYPLPDTTCRSGLVANCDIEVCCFPGIAMGIRTSTCPLHFLHYPSLHSKALRLLQWTSGSC